MTLYETLKGLNLPVAYGQFEEPPTIPFLVYLGNGSDNLIADAKVYYSKNSYEIQYYFSQKNESLEQELENYLTDNNLVWTKSEDIYVESENLYYISYII